MLHNRFKNLMIVLAMLFVLALASRGQATVTANSHVWSSAGAGCTLQANSVSAARFNGGSVDFLNNATGTIQLTCPIEGIQNRIAGAQIKLYLAYLDSDGSDTHCRVSVRLLRTSTDSSGVGWDITDLSSDSYVDTAAAVKSLTISENLNFDTSYYWVMVQVFRDTQCWSRFDAVGLKY
jgi:hypothetical protein